MIIRNCYIENFGCFRKYTHDFSDGLNIIREDNGWGKSTLVAFIRAMFFGLPSNKVQSITENDRRRYMPWQGGAFGGSIDFNADGREWRIERFFGQTERLDRFKLIDLATNTESHAYGPDIGEVLFGLDAASYARSSFIAHNGKSVYDKDKMSNIKARLIGLLVNADDLGCYDGAIEMLNRKCRELSKNGGRGSIADAENKIAELEREADTCCGAHAEYSNCMSAVAELNLKISENDSQQKELDEKIKALRKDEQTSSARENYKRLSEKLEECETRKSELTGYFRDGIPDKNQLDAAEDDVRTLGILNDRRKSLEITARDIEGRLEDITRQTVPDGEMLNACAENNKKLVALNTELTMTAASAADTESLGKCRKHFINKDNQIAVPSDSEISEMLTLDAKYRSAQEELSSLGSIETQGEQEPEDIGKIRADVENSRQNSENLTSECEKLTEKINELQSKTSRRIGLAAPCAVSVIGIAVVAVGLAVSLIPLWIAGIVTGIAGLLWLTAELVRLLGISENRRRIEELRDELNGKQREKSNAEAVYALETAEYEAALRTTQETKLIKARNDRIRELTAATGAYRATLDGLLAKYRINVTDRDGYSCALNELYRVKSEYLHVSAVMKDINNRRAELRERISQVNDNIRQTLGDACDDDNIYSDYSEIINRLSSLSGERERLRNLQDINNTAIYANQTDITGCTDRLKAFFTGYITDTFTMTPDKAHEYLNLIKGNMEKYNSCLTESENWKNTVRDFLRDNPGVSEVCDTAEPDVTAEELTAKKDELAAEYKSLISQRAKTERMAEEYAETASALPGLQNQIEVLTEGVKKDRARLSALKKTAELLTEAHTGLTSRYIGVMEQSFNKYFGMLDPRQEMKGSFDTELQPSFRIAGEGRSALMLSDGWRDLAEICIRLSLVDALYKKEKPFLILDDPMSDADDRNVAAVLSMLRGISSEYQIIYLTCADSRAPVQ